MGLVNSGGTAIAKASFPASTVSVPARDVKKQLTADVYERYRLPGESSELGTGKRLKFRNGQIVTQGQIDDAYATATISSVTPATGAAAGGTAIVIRGTNLDGASGVTVGGVAATAFSVVSPTEIHCTTGAHATGAVNVAVADDSGGVTATGAFTYV
jgi:hypothetical protein